MLHHTLHARSQYRGQIDMFLLEVLVTFLIICSLWRADGSYLQPTTKLCGHSQACQLTQCNVAIHWLLSTLAEAWANGIVISLFGHILTRSRLPASLLPSPLVTCGVLLGTKFGCEVQVLEHHWFWGLLFFFWVNQGGPRMRGNY